MGKALVTEPPSWQDMNQKTLDAWWSQVMTTQNWYATQALTKARVRIASTTKQEDII